MRLISFVFILLSCTHQINIYRDSKKNYVDKYGLDYCVCSLKEMQQLDDALMIAYAGSDNDYHLFQRPLKTVPNNSCERFAVQLAEYSPKTYFTIDEWHVAVKNPYLKREYPFR